MKIVLTISLVVLCCGVVSNAFTIRGFGLNLQQAEPSLTGSLFIPLSFQQADGDPPDIPKQDDEKKEEGTDKEGGDDEQDEGGDDDKDKDDKDKDDKDKDDKDKDDLTDEEVKKAFERVDKNSDGKIEFDELFKGCDKDVLFNIIWNLADANKNGSLDLEEYKKYLKAFRKAVEKCKKKEDD